jgi:hypothetical protein
MPHELLFALSHSEAKRYVHSCSPKEVVARQPTRQASWAHNGSTALNGELHISRYFFHPIFRRMTDRGISTQLEQAGNSGQFQSEQVVNSSRERKYLEEESSIGDELHCGAYSR